MKKNIWKQLLSLALALVMVAGMLPHMATEAKAATDSYDYGFSFSMGETYCSQCRGAMPCTYLKINSLTVANKQMTVSYEYKLSCCGQLRTESDTCYFLCTTNYTDYPVHGGSTFKFSRKAGHLVDTWTTSDGKHRGNCVLCGYVEERCSGGTATCIAKAKCSVCKQEYGNLSTHSLTYTAENNVITETCTVCNNHTATATLTLKSNDDIVYNGQPHVGVEFIEKSMNWDVVTNRPSVTYENNINAGENTAKVSMTFGGVTATQNFTISKAAPTAEHFTFTAPEMTYDGSEKAATVALASPYTGAGAITVEYYNGETKLDGAPTDAGEYTIKINVAEGDNFNAATGLTSEDWKFTITPANLADCEVTMTPASGTYTGSYHDKPAYTLTYNGKQLVEGTDYRVEGGWTGDFTNAGDSILDLTGTGNFTGTKTLTYTIGKATPDFTAPAAKELTYSGEPQALVEAGSVNPGKLLYRLGDGEYSETVPTATNAGDYTVYYMVEGLDTDNYNEVSSGSVSVTIRKAEAPDITFPEVLNEITYGQKLEEAKLSFYTNDYGTFSWNASTSVPNAGTAGYALDFYPNELALQNYDWKDAGEAQWIADRNALCICPNVTVNKAPSTVTAPTAVSGLVYNKSAQTLIAAGSTNDGTIVYALDKEGEYITELPQATAAGTYHVWYKVIGDSNHNDSTPTPVEVKIAKADPGIGDVTAGVVNDTLATSAIVLTRENTDIPGALTVDAGQTLAWGDNIIRYTFTPNDAANYEVVKGEVAVAVVDTIAPTGTVTISTKSWTEFLNDITVSLFFKETQTVSVTASDNLSGVARIEYIESKTALDLDAVKAATQWTEMKNGSVSVTLEDTKQFIYYIRITDKSGNVAYLSTDGAEYDTTAPMIEGVNNGATCYTTQTVTVTDKNIDTITLNGEAATGSISLAGNKEATYTIVATDKAGNTTTVTVKMAPIADITKSMVGKTADNVTSAYKANLQAIVDTATVLLKDKDITAEEKTELEKAKADAAALIKVIEDTTAEQKAVTDKAAQFDEDAVKSTDKTELAELAEDMEALLDTNNLTQDERAALKTDLEQIKDMIDTINKTAADKETATDTVDSYDPATVTSSDKAAIESALDTIEDLLDTDHLTAGERNALEDVKADAEILLDAIEEAAKAADTDNTAKVENVTVDNVTPDDKSDLEKAKTDLEDALKNNGGNYTEEEKKSIEDEIQRIEGALETIENVETVEDVISDLPTTVDPDDEETVVKIEEAKKAYDELTDYEKSLVDEKVKEKLDKLTAAAVDYEIVKGDGGNWSKDTTSGLSFTANGSFAKFVSVEIDGKVIDAKHYSAKSGSTVITLDASYLETLSIGTHTITVVYADGEAEGTFQVNATESNILLWIAIVLVCVAAIVVLIINRKRFLNNSK